MGAGGESRTHSRSGVGGTVELSVKAKRNAIAAKHQRQRSTEIARNEKLVKALSDQWLLAKGWSLSQIDALAGRTRGKRMDAPASFRNKKAESKPTSFAECQSQVDSCDKMKRVEQGKAHFNQLVNAARVRTSSLAAALERALKPGS